MSAKLLCIISNQFLDKNKAHFKQFQMIFNQICQYINSNYQPDEKKNWVVLYKQQQAGQMEKMHIVETDEYHLAKLDNELSTKLDTIELIDHHAFKEGIDVESTSY